jgi:hypothetical protein
MTFSKLVENDDVKKCAKFQFGRANGFGSTGYPGYDISLEKQSRT